MKVSSDEADEALKTIQKVADRTRRSVASGGTSLVLIITGVIWLVGFLANQFLTGLFVMYLWVGMSLFGSALAVWLGSRMGRRVRSEMTSAYTKRVSLYWLLLVFYCAAAIAITRPTDGRQITMIIILFIMMGQLAMGILFSFSSAWWPIPITALALAGYFLLPGFFYLWMAVLAGGGMIALGLYIYLRGKLWLH